MSSYLEEIIGKENTTAFIAELKNAFQTTEKTNEKSIVDLTIQGGEEPSGITLETFNVDGDQYLNYIDEGKEYMNDAVSVFTLSIGAKDPASIGIFETFF